MTRALAPALLLALAACSSPQSRSTPAPPANTASAFPAARQTTTGRFYVVYTPTTLPVRVNEPFGLDVRVYRDGSLRQPADGVTITADAAMPAHHHGMTLTPRATATPGQPGAFRVEGMLLHMPGDWEIYIDVRENGQEDRARFELHL